MYVCHVFHTQESFFPCSISGRGNESLFHHVLLQLIRAAWQAASERLQGFDELSMASLRFRQTLRGEPASTDPHVLRPFEVSVWVRLGASLPAQWIVSLSTALSVLCTTYM